uniref:Putative ovule protein n=1 Tax=Solanum chacoense TaxID=4108 RepID=A0A0V0HZW1_SOLCH
MESVVLNYLKFEMTALTAKCFLRRFVRVAQGLNEVLSLQLEHLASYIAELSLFEYNMFFLCSITHCYFCNFLGQIYFSSFRETLELYLEALYFVPTL